MRLVILVKLVLIYGSKKNSWKFGFVVLELVVGYGDQENTTLSGLDF